MKKRHRKTRRGTVLFTTVSVMALLIIFLMGTLVLASASNSRAHKSYSTSQASYTARAAIDSFVEAMIREGAIAAAVQEIAKPGSGTTTKVVDVIINDPSLGKIGYIDADGVFQENKIIIENIGGGEYEYINDEGKSLKGSDSGITGGKWVELDRVKITASAKVGTEIETVSAYVRKKPGNRIVTPPSSNAPTVKGIQMTGSAGFPAGENITGGLGVNLGNLEADVCTKIRNKMSISTSLSFINSSLVWNTSDADIYIKESNPAPNQQGYLPYSQTIINGSLYVPNNRFVKLDYKMPDDYQPGQWSNKEVPYVYVDGALVAQAGAQVEQIGANKSPFNLFVGTFVTNSNNNQLASTNLYMMDEYTPAESYTVYTDVETRQTADGVSFDTGSQKANNNRGGGTTFVKGDNYLGEAGTTKLNKWTQSIASGSSSTSDVGGSVFCNGRLTLQDVEVDGDVRVAGDCIIERKAIIHGDLIVGGNIIDHTQNPGDFKVDGTKSENAGSGGGGGTPVTSVVEVDNLLVPEGSVDMSSMEEIPLNDAVKLNYIEWTPVNHLKDNTTPVDPWGEPVQDDVVVYYKWADGETVTVDMINATNMFANYKSFEELDADSAFTALRDKIQREVYRLSPQDPDAKRIKHIDGSDYYYYGVPKIEGGVAVPSGTEADENETYYKNKTTNTVITQTEINALPTQPEHYIRCLPDADHTPSGEEAPGPKTYYRNGDPNDFTFDASEAQVSGPVQTSGVYPESMKRENIYGKQTSSGFEPAPQETKIITTLQEARQSLGLKEDGEINPTVYPSVFDGTQEGAPNVTSLPYAINNATLVTPDVFGGTSTRTVKINGQDREIQFAAITQSCKIKGSVIGDASRELKLDNGKIVVQKDKGQVNGSNEAFKVLCFKPGTEDLYVVLEDVRDNESLAFIVDRNPDTDGQVYFIVDGALQTGNKMMIIPSYYQAGMSFDYTKDWGITYFGTYGSSINITNDSTLVGCFRMPYTKFSANVRGQVEVTYTGEDGKTRTGKPTIVGNALFAGVNATNDFINYYTATGGQNNNNPSSSGGSFNTEVGYFDIDYMLGS